MLEENGFFLIMLLALDFAKYEQNSLISDNVHCKQLRSCYDCQ